MWQGNARGEAGEVLASGAMRKRARADIGRSEGHRDVTKAAAKFGGGEISDMKGKCHNPRGENP